MAACSCLPPAKLSKAAVQLRELLSTQADRAPAHLISKPSADMMYRSSQKSLPPDASLAACREMKAAATAEDPVQEGLSCRTHGASSAAHLQPHWYTAGLQLLDLQCHVTWPMSTGLEAI